MGDIIQFIPKSERERTRLIREARAIYESIFPSSAPASEHGDKVPAGHKTSSARRSDGGLLS
jgi:hypothetical protein